MEGLELKKDIDTPDMPKITKSLCTIKWTEVSKDFLAQVISVRVIPLSYVIHKEETVSAQVPSLTNNQPHSTKHGSVEAELIARASHNHALFHDDNAAVYHHFKEATRSTSYVTCIKLFQHTKNGREAWLAGQYAGINK